MRIHNSFSKRLRSLKSHTKLLLALVTATIVGAASGAVVFASIPDSSGVIHACYGTGLLNKGDVRIIDNSNSTCNSNETAISWNQQGQQGPAGPAGPQGPAGSSSSGTIGHVLTVSWGSIPSGGTSQLIYSVPGFGDVYASECDSSGNTDYSFTNTSGQTIVNQNGSDDTIAPNETVTGSSGNFPYNISIGNGPTSIVGTIAVEPNVSTTNQTCTFDGFGLVTSN